MDDWPTSLTKQGTYLWAPAPAVANVAGEYMAAAIHKRSTSTHIFVCPRLMSSRWFKFISKATDVFVRIPIGCTIWGFDQHEPLMLAIVFPLSRSSPWKHGNSTHVQHASANVQRLLLGNFERSGPALRELVDRAWTLGVV
jgi:hypothetical protein